MSAPSFRFDRLSVGYGVRVVLNGLCGSFESGRMTALIGPNGSGKSTLIRALAGLIPHEGRLSLGGRETRSFSRREFGRLVGVVPQQLHITYPFSVWEVVGMGLLPWKTLLSRTTEEDEARIAAAAERADVGHLLLRDVSSLSGGETQRTFLAMVLAQDPPVLLLDEPTSALDPRHSTRVFSILKALAGQGRTVVAAVHDVNLALAFADRFLALKDGTIVAGGPVRELDAAVLESLYDAPFQAYRSDRGEVLFQATGACDGFGEDKEEVAVR
ncbi:MAG: ABC transporter ATP-binding protein [Fretibacterium sp.]|nr:ABC transporter ATP-binding protein [Fretibacterium sp.]